MISQIQIFVFFYHQMNHPQHKQHKKLLVTIEGNIGGGKSTMINLLRKEYPDFVIIDEPVGVWTSMVDENGKNLLELFYTDKQRWSYTFQNAAFITRYLSAFEALNKPVKEDTIYISERGVLTDRYVFASMLKDSKYLNEIEWQLYTKWFDHFSSLIDINALVYITTKGEICSERIKKRGRIGEEGIPQEYLNELDEYHERWLTSTTLPVLRVTSEPENVHLIALFVKKLLVE